MSELPTLTHKVAAVEIGPDDLIIIEADRRLTIEQAEHIKAQVNAVLPGHRVIVMPPELHFGVGRKIT